MNFLLRLFWLRDYVHCRKPSKFRPRRPHSTRILFQNNWSARKTAFLSSSVSVRVRDACLKRALYTLFKPFLSWPSLPLVSRQTAETAPQSSHGKKCNVHVQPVMLLRAFNGLFYRILSLLPLTQSLPTPSSIPPTYSLRNSSLRTHRYPQSFFLPLKIPPPPRNLRRRERGRGRRLRKNLNRLRQLQIGKVG